MPCTAVLRLHYLRFVSYSYSTFVLSSSFCYGIIYPLLFYCFDTASLSSDFLLCGGAARLVLIWRNAYEKESKK